MLGGFRSAHLARQTADVGLWRAQIGSFAHLLAEMSANWGGWLPAEIDVGGGWPSPRDPVGRRAARARTRPLPSDVADYRVTETGPDIAALIGEDSVELEIADLDAGDGRIIELIRYARPAGRPVWARSSDPGSSHIALRVDDLGAALECIQGSPARQISRHPVLLHDPGGGWDGVACCYIADPDGNIIELVQRPRAGPQPLP